MEKNYCAVNYFYVSSCSILYECSTFALDQIYDMLYIYHVHWYANKLNLSGTQRKAHLCQCLPWCFSSLQPGDARPGQEVHQMRCPAFHLHISAGPSLLGRAAIYLHANK